MPDIGGMRSSSLDAPRSPASCSTESSPRGSSKQSHPPEEDPEPPTPSSPPVRLTRKRAATLNTERANLPQSIGDLVINSASTTGLPTPDLTREQVCLCQPDPKIPRPRNAFILYRQHYQAQVIAQNPGLANPEISKIIGEQWREQAPEVKNDWKRLAEEEKQRHRRQYPGYRYQPRRVGKPTGVRPISASFSDDPGRCPKCSGRYISTPTTPSTPFAHSFGAGSASHNEGVPLSFTATTVSRYPHLQQSSSLAPMHSVRTDSSQTSPFHQQSPRRAPYPHTQQLQTHHEKDEDIHIQLNPPTDQKRRRFNPEPQLKRGYPSPSPISFSSTRPCAHNELPIAAPNYRHQQHLGPDMLLRSGNTSHAQQESHTAQQPRHLYPSRSDAFDESLRLPPLQTQLSGPSQSAYHRTDLRAENRDNQARSVAAMVMTIPYISKIKVLTKISPPLLPPSAASPAQQIRGAVIAVESADKILLSEVGAFIKEHLARDDSCAIKTWTISRLPQSVSAPAGDTEMVGTEQASTDPIPTENTAGNSFVEYLTIISEWHKKSQEITKYITTIPDPPSVDAASASQRAVPMSKVIPIALLPNGFSLTTSDTFASRIPINDSYAPVDHWQWMATLWRGIVGPDLTVYVKRVDREEMERHGGVEVRGDCGGIVVRVAETAKLDEKTARRLGFEVIEFVRGVEAGLHCRMD